MSAGLDMQGCCKGLGYYGHFHIGPSAAPELAQAFPPHCLGCHMATIIYPDAEGNKDSTCIQVALKKAPRSGHCGRCGVDILSQYHKGQFAPVGLLDCLLPHVTFPLVLRVSACKHVAVS